MTKFNAGKMSVLALTAVFGLSLVLLVNSLTKVYAHEDDDEDGQDSCNQVFVYPTKTSDFNDPRININFHNSDQQIDVSAHTGYAITEVALEVPDDGFSGFHVYATGPISNFNPPGSHDITGAKVKVKKVCATSTPTATPVHTATPTATPKQDDDDECEHDECQTATPTATPTPVAEPTATPTPDPDVCPNLDGIQTGIPDTYHKDPGTRDCIQYEMGGAPPPSGSATGGQVLGASTMAGTGTFTENLYMAIMGLGAIITALGAKNFKKAFKVAR